MSAENLKDPRTVLIVDDDDAHRLMLRETLKDRKFRSIEAASGEEGLKVLESEVVDAPMSGERLFQARARLLAPASLTVEELRLELERLAADLIVEVRLEEPKTG